MEKKFKSKITAGMLLFLMALAIVFATSAFAATGEADKTATEEIGVAYRGHVQNQGNMPKPEGTMVAGPEALGTRGQSLRVEGFWIELTGNVPEGANIVYEVHVQNEGWMKPEQNGAFAGTTGESQRVESIKIRLENLPGYDVYYRGHVQNVGDTPMVDGEWGWKKNGEELGTTGSSLRLEELQVKIVKQPAVTYDKAGTYGPKTGIEVVENDVAINTPDVVLQNLHIKGNLTIGEGVGEGDVTLNNITVDGETYVRGGGKNSIHINGGEYNKITVQQTSSGQVRIVATDAAGLEVVVSEDAKGEDIILEGAFENVQIDAPDVKISTQGDTTIKDMVVSEKSTGSEITLEGAFENVQIDAPDVKVSTQGDTSIKDMVLGEKSTGSEITLDKDTTVNKIDLNSSVDMKGEGTIEKANVNSDDVTFEQKPVEEVVAPEVKVPPVVTPPEPQKPDPTPTEPSGPTAEDLLVAEFNNTKNNVAMLELIQKNALGLDLTGFDKLDYLGESIVNQTLLNKDGFANKAAVQAAITEGIKLAQDNAPAKAYMEALFSYTPNLSVEDNTCTVTYPKELTTIQKSLLSGLYADLVIMIDTPLTDGEVLELTVNGIPKQVSNKDLAGKEILLSKLLGRKLGDDNLVQNQKSTFTISVKDVSTKVERYVTVCPCTSKNGEEYFKNFTNAYALMLTPFWLEAYADTLTVEYKNSEFLFNYAGNLTDGQKQGLAGYYADTIIRLDRPLVAGESIKISGMGTAATLSSSTVMDNVGKTEIRLSKLLGVTLGTTNLAVNQKGDQKVSLTDVNLIRSNGISVNAVLAKANGVPIDTGKGYGTPVYPTWVDEYRDAVSLSAENSKITVNYKGNLSPATVTGLGAYQADVIIYLDRELEDDETITVKVLDETATLSKAKLVDNQIKLSELMDVIPQTAAAKSGDDVIEFSVDGLNHNINVYANPILVNNDDLVYLNNSTSLLLCLPCFKAYSDSVELSTVDNKFLVNYKGGLLPTDQEKLDGYYADAMIYLDRALEANEMVKVKAFTKVVEISNTTPAEDDEKRCYRLSELLNIKLGDANLAVNQKGSFEISVEENTLETQLNVSARAILVKDSDIEYLDNYTGMSINPPGFGAYDNSVQINIDNYQGFTITHKGSLSADDIKNLDGFYGDTLISFERPLEFGESIKVSAYDKVAVITSSSFKKWGDNRIGLTELLGISAAEAPPATEQGNDIKISFSEINIKSPIGVAAWKGLVKGDGKWVYRANNGIGFSLYPLFIDAYKNNITLITGENKISVTYAGQLSNDAKTALEGYYADAMINLNRPLVGNEKVTINAFEKSLTVDSTMVTDNNGTQIRLSDLLKITLGQDQLAANQTGGFDITVTDNTLKSDLTIFAEAILVKGDDFEYLQKAASLNLKSTIFETAVAAYTAALTVSQVDNTFNVSYAGGLSETDKAGLNGFYSDAMIYLNRPLVAGEEVSVNAFGEDIPINSSMIKETDGNSIRLSQLLGLTLGNDQLAANQKGGFDITVTDKSLKSDLNITADAVLVKGDETKHLDNKFVSMQVKSQTFKEAVAAYTNAIKVKAEEQTFYVSYAGNLSEKVKVDLNGNYADAWICLSRPLEEGEEVIINAFGKDWPVTKSTFTDAMTQNIYLSDLLGLKLGEAQLAEKQEGTFEINVTDKNLIEPMSVTAYACLRKVGGDDQVINDRFASIELGGFDEYEASIDVQNDYPSIRVIFNKDKISQQAAEKLDNLYADTRIFFGRELEENETVTLEAYEKTVTIHASDIRDINNGISLAKITGLTLDEKQLATIKNGVVEIKVTDMLLQKPMNISVGKSLVRADGSLVFNSRFGQGFILNPPDIAAYVNSLSVTAENNQFLVTYAGVDENAAKGLDGYYADAMVYLNRPLENGEIVKVNAFENDYIIDAGKITDNENKIRLSTLLGINLGEDQLAAKQSGRFNISIVPQKLNADLEVYAQAILVKADGDITELNRGATLMVTNGTDQPAPVDLTGLTPTTAENTDGMIIGTTGLMEYKLQAAEESAYMPCTDTTTIVAEPGTYVVRKAAQTGCTAGATAAVTVSPWNETDVKVEYQGFVDATESGWLINRGMLETRKEDFSFDAIQVNLTNAPTGAKISYQTYNGSDNENDLGWTEHASNGGTAGMDNSDGTKTPIEAIKLELENMPGYSVIYQVYVKDWGWQCWVRDDAMAGTEGSRLPIEAIRIRIVRLP